MPVQLLLHDLTELIIAKGIVVHRYFGPGLFETVYKRSLGLLLVEAGPFIGRNCGRICDSPSIPSA